MKRVLFVFFFLLGFLIIPNKVLALSQTVASSSEDISSFDTTITVLPQRALSIKEVIQYETVNPRHGIYRYIPVSYNVDGKRTSLRVHDINVTGILGQSIPVSQSNDGQNLTLKIGDPNQTFSGAKTYNISYKVDDALQMTPQGMRLYWDITGEGWTFPILSSSAIVVSSGGSIDSVACYSGSFGSNNGGCTATKYDAHNAIFRYAQTINSGDNLTIDLQFAGTTGFILPTPVSQLTVLFWKLIWMLPFLVLPVICFLIWYRYGRDYMFVRYDPNDQSDRPKILKPIFMRITPPFVYAPLDITPGQAGCMLDETYGINDIVSDILDLAKKRYLTIVQTKEQSLFVPADYQFTKLKSADAELPEHEKIILQSLFTEDKKQVLLSELSGSFAGSIVKIQAAVFEELFSQTFFTRNPWGFKQALGASGVFMYILFFISLRFVLPIMLLSPMTFISIVVLAVLNIACGYFFIDKLTQKTAKGFNYYLLARGLKETIKRGQWREQIMEKHLFVEDMLPFAVAFNVVGQLTKDMQALGLEPPTYVPTSFGRAIGSGMIMHELSSNLATSLAYSPNSGVWSSGGGGFGGGFSGGGGGGGGGGSW